MELRIDPVLNAFRKWREADAAYRKTQKPGNTSTVEHNAERVAAHEFQTALETFVGTGTTSIPSNIPGLSDTVFSDRVIDNVAPIPKCVCSHTRDQHLMLRGKCGNIECNCTEFVKVLETGRVRRA